LHIASSSRIITILLSFSLLCHIPNSLFLHFQKYCSGLPGFVWSPVGSLPGPEITGNETDSLAAFLRATELGPAWRGDSVRIVSNMPFIYTWA
jgi:hypothetical protein